MMAYCTIPVAQLCNGYIAVAACYSEVACHCSNVASMSRFACRCYITSDKLRHYGDIVSHVDVPSVLLKALLWEIMGPVLLKQRGIEPGSPLHP